MEMTSKAKKLWKDIPKEIRPKLLNNVFYGKCESETGIGNVIMKVEKGDLVLRGICTKCSGPVCRVIEQE